MEELSNEIKSNFFLQEIDAADTHTAMETLANFIARWEEPNLIVISAGTGDINDDLNWQLENETIRTNVSGFAALANVAIHHFIEKGFGNFVGIFS